MIQTKKIILLDDFQKHLFSEFSTYCKRYNLKSSQERFLTFLIDEEIISHVTLKRYAVQKEFKGLYLKLDNQKTKTVKELSDKYGIPSRSVWGILTKKKGKPS